MSACDDWAWTRASGAVQLSGWRNRPSSTADVEFHSCFPTGVVHILTSLCLWLHNVTNNQWTIMAQNYPIIANFCGCYLLEIYLLTFLYICTYLQIYLVLNVLFSKCLMVEYGNIIMKNCDPANNYQHWSFIWYEVKRGSSSIRLSESFFFFFWNIVQNRITMNI